MLKYGCKNYMLVSFKFKYWLNNKKWSFDIKGPWTYALKKGHWEFACIKLLPCDTSQNPQTLILNKVFLFLWTIFMHPFVCPCLIRVRSISYIVWGRNPKFDVLIHLEVLECRIQFSGHLGLVSILKKSCGSICHIVTHFLFFYVVCHLILEPIAYSRSCCSWIPY